MAAGVIAAMALPTVDTPNEQALHQGRPSCSLADLLISRQRLQGEEARICCSAKARRQGRAGGGSALEPA